MLLMSKEHLQRGKNEYAVSRQDSSEMSSGNFVFSLPKGQLISECLVDVLNFPKNQRKIWQISAPESKKWWNQQNEYTFY